VDDLCQLDEERPRRTVSYLLTACPPDGRVAGHEQYRLVRAVLGREALQHRVRIRCERDGQRAEPAVRADAVEHDDTARAVHRDEARQEVDELIAIAERARVEEVRPVEQIEGRL
jgi:hypothetical protein